MNQAKLLFGKFVLQQVTAVELAFEMNFAPNRQLPISPRMTELSYFKQDPGMSKHSSGKLLKQYKADPPTTKEAYLSKL